MTEQPRAKESLGSPEDLEFVAGIRKDLHSLGVTLTNPAVKTFPDGTVRYWFVAESGSKRLPIWSDAPFHKVEGAAAKITGDVRDWLSGADASKDGLLGKRWGVATDDDDFMR